MSCLAPFVFITPMNFGVTVFRDPSMPVSNGMDMGTMSPKLFALTVFRSDICAVRLSSHGFRLSPVASREER